MRIAIVKLGYRNLLLHKLRSFLTLLGMVLGVSSVIAMLAIGEGSKQEAIEQNQAAGCRQRDHSQHQAGGRRRRRSGCSGCRSAAEFARCWSMACSTATTTCMKATLPTVKKVVPIALIRRNCPARTIPRRECSRAGCDARNTRRSSTSSSTAAAS